jgi:26S proteasome regulatory subunit (ATPase 3-interacting protein)
MAPRTPKPKAEDADPLKPKTEKAKIEKTKVEKPKGEKVKAEKKPKAEKTEKVKVEKKIPAERVNKGDTEKGEKEKVKAVTGDEAMELIAVYLKAQNRPYSATEISANLRGKVSLSPLFQNISNV